MNEKKYAIDLLIQQRKAKNLRELAAILNINESTISRWTHHKKIGNAWARLIIQKFGEEPGPSNV